MKLTGKQKKFIKHNKKELSSLEIAQKLEISETDVLDYFKKQLSEDEYSRYKSGIPKDETKESPPFSFKEFFQANWLMFGLLAVLVIIVYANALTNAFVSDDIAIYQIKDIGSPTFVFSTGMHFIGNLFYSIAYHIGEYTPLFYRFNSILFHLGAVFGVYVLFSLLVNTTLGFIIGALFAVHPILIESITWISGGQYVQSGFFCLWALISYILFQQNKRIRYFIASLVLSILALLSSEKAIVFPFIFLLYEISFGNLKKNGKYVFVFFLLMAVPALYYFSQIFVRMDALATSYYQEKTVINPFFQIPIAISSYIQLIVWPDVLTLYHSEMSFSMVEYLVRLGVFLGVVVALGYGFIKNKMVFFWLSFFIICLSPTLTPFGISWIVAERYAYLGSVGVMYFIGYALMKLALNEKTKTGGYLLFVVILFGLMSRTVIRNFDWKSEDSLWIATGKTSPSDPKTHNNLGDVYGRQGNLQRSAEEFEMAIKLKPGYADAFHNLGNVKGQMGKFDEAVANYQKAIQYNPKLWQSHQNLAAIYFNQKQFDLAEKNLMAAIQIDQENANLYAQLGVVYLQTGNKDKAKQAFMGALNRDSENKLAKEGLAASN